MMIKKLRSKFVLVTVIMMVTLFTVLWAINNINNRYWIEQDYLAVAELVSYSGIFSDEYQIDKENIFEELTDGTPIIGIIADESGNIFEKKVVGRRDQDAQISDKLIKDMLDSPPERIKIENYVFTKKQLSDNNYLLVAVSMEGSDSGPKKIISNLLLAGLGLFLLFLVAVFLSRYVTKPAKEALEKEKRFISDASHELKTPLGAININAQALEMNGEKSIYVRNILSESKRMNRLVERLLTLSKLEDDSHIEMREFSISDIVSEMILTYESIAFEKNRKLIFEVEPDIFIFGNDDEIRQLVAILVDNAIKNSFDGTDIIINCTKKGKHTNLTVCNEGNGIDESEMDYIFDRFYTTEHSRTGGSFGLGLAIAKAIVERHKGTINVSSTPKEGSKTKETVFSIVF